MTSTSHADRPSSLQHPSYREPLLTPSSTMYWNTPRLIRSTPNEIQRSGNTQQHRARKKNRTPVISDKHVKKGGIGENKRKTYLLPFHWQCLLWSSKIGRTKQAISVWYKSWYMHIYTTDSDTTSNFSSFWRHSAFVPKAAFSQLVTNYQRIAVDVLLWTVRNKASMCPSGDNN